MKFVYALVSSENDFYAEEAFVSMYSLKRNNPDAKISMAADNQTMTSLVGNRGRIKEFIDEYIVINPPEDFSPIQKSRFIKTSVRKYIEGDFLYIDNDTLITGDLSDIENLNVEIGAVYDNHNNSWGIEHPFPQLVEYFKCLGFKNIPSYDITHHFNGGLIYARDLKVTHELYQKWHNIWLNCQSHGFYYDQPALWYANLEMKNIITPLNGIYNCQILDKNSLRYFDNARIIHYFSSSMSKGFFMQDKENLKYIRNRGIDYRINSLINNAKEDYWNNLILLGGKETEIYNSPSVILARKLSRDFPWTNKLAKVVYQLFGYKI